MEVGALESIFKKSPSCANYLQANDYELHEGRSRDYLFSKTKFLGTKKYH